MPGTNIGIDAKYAKNEQGKYEPTGNISLTSEFRRNKKEKPVEFGNDGKIPMYNNGGGIEDPQLKELYSSLYGLSFPGYPKTLDGTSVTQIKPLSTNQMIVNRVI